MELSVADKKTIIEDIILEYDGKLDGGRKNIPFQNVHFVGMVDSSMVFM